MKIQFTLFDSKTETHSPFGLFKSVAEAKRSLVISLRQAPDIPPSQFPDDFTLCSVGTFDENAFDNPYKVEPLAVIGSVSVILKEFLPKDKNA